MHKVKPTFGEVKLENFYKKEVYKLILTYWRSLIHFIFFF